MTKPIRIVGDLEFRPAETPEAPPPGARLKGVTRLERRAARTWNRYGKSMAEGSLKMGIPVNAALSVFIVEAGGRAYDPRTGLVIIRYEPHVFRRLSGASVRAARGGQSSEWGNLERAAAIDPDAAFKSVSWGLPQLMGFNWRVTKHDGPKEMALAFQRSCEEQVAGFFGFIQANDLGPAIRRRAWKSFAKTYNGPGQVDHYSTVLKAAYDAVNGIFPKGIGTWEN